MFALSSASVYAGDADFTLVNRTGFDISEVYISATGAQKWGSDILRHTILEDAHSLNISFSDKASCAQDIRVVFEDDNSKAEWGNVDLCKWEKITIKYNRKTGEVIATGE